MKYIRCALPLLVVLSLLCACAPSETITPIFPEPQSKKEPIPYDEGEFDMRDGDILAASFAQALEVLSTREDERPVTVWLKGGSYAEPLELNGIKDVTFRNVPGEEVIFTGSVEISGWQEDQVGGVPCWSMPWEGEYFTSLYHADKQLNRPRYPAEGYLFVDHMDGARAAFTEENAPWEWSRGHTSFFAKEGDLRQFHAMQDINLRIMHLWIDELSNLISYNDETRELVWDHMAMARVLPGERYFLENVFEELKSPGQWYLDRESSKLYYIPFPGEDMASTTLYAGMHERLLTIDNVENVTIQGITFKNSAWQRPKTRPDHWPFHEGLDRGQAAFNVHPCVLVANSTGVTFDRCRFENIGATALKLYENVHRSAVTSCTFEQIGGNAVFIEGLFEAPNTNITVHNNLIARYGRRFYQAIGVLNIHAHHVEITHNEIFDGYYTAISSGWVWGYGENPTDHVLIENNLIYQIGQGWLSDMGGIYTLGLQPNSVIRGNVIHNVAADPLQGGYGGWGIYPDEGSTGQLIEKNLVYNCGSQSFHQHYGKGNIVRNNIFAFSGEGQTRISRKEDHPSIILVGNIIVSEGQPMYTNVHRNMFIDGGNLYWDYATPGKIISGDKMDLRFSKMRRLGFYNQALIADPLFKDPANFDFTLALNSPAVTQLGFEVWDFGEAGRTGP